MSKYGYLDQLINENTSSSKEAGRVTLEICRHEAGMLPLNQMTDKASSIYLQWEEEMEVESGSSKSIC